MRAVMVLCDRVGDVGGAERYWETVLPALASSGAHVRVLAREVDGNALAARGTREVRWADEDGAPSPEAARVVAEEIARERPDAVVTASVFDTAVLDAVHAAAARWIVRIHDHRAFCPTGDRVYPQFEAPCTAAMGGACRAAAFARGCIHGPRPSSFRRIAAREAVRDRIARADTVLVSSEHMRGVCTANGIAAARIAITPPPLPDDAYAIVPAPRPRERRLVFASRLTPRKGLRSLLGALAKLSPAERPLLVVAGEGEAEEHAARAQALRDGIAVAWRGKLTAAELRAELDRADAVAVPSLWPEPFGLVGIEAQARGRPAVAYDVGGIGDWIARAGIAVRRGDEAAFAAAIRTVVSEPAWPALSSAAHARAEEYRLGAHAERLIGILEGERKAA